VQVRAIKPSAAVAVAIGGFVVAELAFYFNTHSTESPFVWLPMGIYAAVLVTLGSRFWPALALGVMLAATAAGQSLLLLVPGTATAVLGPWLLARYLEHSGFNHQLSRSADVVRFGAATLVTSAVTPSILFVLPIADLPTGNALLRAWANWWLCSTIGIALIVPIALGLTRGAWRELQTQRGLALTLLVLALVFLAAANLVPAAARTDWLGPVAILITVVSAIRLNIALTAVNATIMTIGIGVATLTPASEARQMVNAGSAWAFGMALVVLTLTIHVLLAQRREAQQRLGAAEFAHRVDVIETARAEQERLARDMHDALGQELTAVSLLAHSLHRRLVDATPDLAADASMLADSAVQAQTSARQISRGMTPPLGDEHELATALRALTDRIGQSAKVEIGLTLDDSPLPRLGRQAAECLYRIAQEAVSNALHHARAHRIDVRLAGNTQHSRLEISDDGQGFDLSMASNGHGLGLRTMRYRCEVAGGTLRIESRHGAGTRIVAQLPAVSEVATDIGPEFATTAAMAAAAAADAPR
jgi:signal transduction histidine kinase